MIMANRTKSFKALMTVTVILHSRLSKSAEGKNALQIKRYSSAIIRAAVRASKEAFGSRHTSTFTMVRSHSVVPSPRVAKGSQRSRTRKFTSGYITTRDRSLAACATKASERREICEITSDATVNKSKSIVFHVV